MIEGELVSPLLLKEAEAELRFVFYLGDFIDKYILPEADMAMISLLFGEIPGQAPKSVNDILRLF